jgi:ribonucleoside-diphosphate reductase alpha chain
LLDNIIDCSRFPLPSQALAAKGSRRIGLGITGLADALLMLGLHYGEQAARTQAATLMQTICHAAYRSSIRLAQEKGSFPYFEREPYLQSGFVQTLPVDIRDGIALHGIRNSHLVAIAPAGTSSLLADQKCAGTRWQHTEFHTAGLRMVAMAGNGRRYHCYLASPLCQRTATRAE